MKDITLSCDIKPKITGYTKLHHPNEFTCNVCGDPARWTVCIETSWFRGDDDVVKTCDGHRVWPYGSPADAIAAGFGRAPYCNEMRPLRRERQRLRSLMARGLPPRQRQNGGRHARHA